VPYRLTSIYPRIWPDPLVSEINRRTGGGASTWIDDSGARLNELLTAYSTRPTGDESTRATVEAVFAARAELIRNVDDAQ
jgi:hypothetical protein